MFVTFSEDNRLERMSRLRQFFSAAALWSIFAALLLVLSYPPTSLWPLSLVAFGLYSWLMFEERHEPREVFKLFFLFSFVTKSCSLYWIPHTLIEFSAFPLAAAWGIGLLCYTLMSIPGALAAMILVPLVKKWGGRSWRLVPLIFLFWLFWDFFDYRFFLWIPAQSFGSQPQLLATAGIFGTFGWNIIFYALIASLHSFRERRHWARAGIWCASCVVVLAVAAYIGNREITRLKHHYKLRHKIAMLQGAVGNFEKRMQNRNESPTNENVLRIYRDLVERLALKQKYELKTEELFVFWPETAFPGFPLNDTSLSELLSSWAKLTNAFHLIGAYEEQAKVDPEGGRRPKHYQYNIVTAFDNNGEFRGHYRKMQRMPFGEYVPGDEYYPWIYDKYKFLNEFGKGERYVPLPHNSPDGPVFLPFICFEILQESFVKEAVRTTRAEHPGRDLVLVNPTNDSWFGEGAELFSHSHLARWQAAREQLTLVRPTNTGISMVIAPWGEILSQSRVGTESLILTDLPLSR